MATVGVGFSLTLVTGMGSSTYSLSADNIRNNKGEPLTTISTAVVENRGPGCIGIWPGGNASGPALEYVGAYQRKYVMLGGSNQITFGMPPQISNPFLPVQAQFGSTYGFAAISDDYSLSGAPDYRRGAVATITNTVGFGAGILANATDFGFDRIRGMYIPAQGSIACEVWETGVTGAAPPGAIALLGNEGSSLNMALAQIFLYVIGNTTAPAFLMLSDEPIVAGRHW